jgi:serine phosphatase RsbU (regulator of sigma subunit)
MTELMNLLELYAVLVLINTALAAALWRRHRTLLHRVVFQIWFATLLAFVIQGVQGVLSRSELHIVLGYASVWAINATMAYLIARIAELPFSWRPFLAVLAAACTLSLVFSGLQLGFMPMALPVAVAVALPLLFVSPRALLLRGRRLTFSGKALCVSSLFFAAHNIDFAFLRNRPEYAAFGFTLAIAIVFGLSIFVPAVVLEIMTEQQARVAAEIDVAHRIQTAMLPKHPSIPGIEVTCYMRPADEIGGDYYDICTVGEHTWILLGDVTGHGLRSGLVMLMAQSIMSSIVHARPDIAPGELNRVANRILFQNLQRLDEQRPMTIVSLCRTGDSTDQENRFVVSGSHDNLYVWRAATDEVEVILMDHFPLGLGFVDDLPAQGIVEREFQLAPGDFLFIGTDGVLEAPDGGDYNRGIFGEERLISFLKAHGRTPLEQTKEDLNAALDRFTSGIYHDDVTFLLLRALRVAA